MKEGLLESADKDGLTVVDAKKIMVFQSPLIIAINNILYRLDGKQEYVNDINTELYEYLAVEYRNGNTLKLRLYKEMEIDRIIFHFDKFMGKEVNLKVLKNEIDNFKSITYNPETNDKFVASIDLKKRFIHIYEFIANSNIYESKYIHAEFDKNNGYIKHLDCSINTYTEQQYKETINNPNIVNKSITHKKIWRIDGNIKLENFYKIIFCTFDSNKRYLEELFKIE